MERVVHKARSFKDADEWDRRQQMAMTPQQRILIARQLQRRVYGQVKDVREWHRSR
jgi:hypothetical protein